MSEWSNLSGSQKSGMMGMMGLFMSGVGKIGSGFAERSAADYNAAVTLQQMREQESADA